jgi:dTDP-L-rhamnose 4-epimerase
MRNDVPWSAMILVTGGAGFIGSHIVDALLEEGHEVRVLDALHPLAHDGAPDYLPDDAEVVIGDVRDPDVLDRCLTGVDAVCHQAAMVGLGVDISDIGDFVRHNALGTAELLRALAERRFPGRVVLASSMVVYGEGRYECPLHGEQTAPVRAAEDLAAGRFDPPCPVCREPLRPLPVPEDAPLRPASVYAATKVHQEHLCFAFARETGVPVTALRYHNVYGPRMPRDTPYSGVAAIFMSALARGDSPLVFEDGRQLRDFVHVRDVARANLLALAADAPYRGALNVASGTPHSVGEMATALAQAAGEDAPRPAVTGRWRAGDVRHVFASTRLAEQAIGYRAEVGFDAGMSEFVTAPLRESAA